MSHDDLDDLIKANAKIAKAVQAFPPEVRQQAYDDMMAAYRGSQSSGVKTEGQVPPHGEEPENSSRTKKTAKKATPSKANRPSRAKAPQPAALRDYNFWPQDRQNFSDFAEEKQPKTLQEKNLLAVYWLEQIAQEPEINTAHILAAFKAVRWREAADPVNALQATASVKRWIDTQNMAKLKTTHGGRVYVEHDMPPKAKPTKGVGK